MVGMPLVDIFLIRTLVENVGTSDEGLEGADGQAFDWEDTETRTRTAKEKMFKLTSIPDCLCSPCSCGHFLSNQRGHSKMTSHKVYP